MAGREAAAGTARATRAKEASVGEGEVAAQFTGAQRAVLRASGPTAAWCFRFACGAERRRT